MNGSFARAMLVGCVSAMGALCVFTGGLLLVLAVVNMGRGELALEQGPIVAAAASCAAGGVALRWLARWFARATAG